LIHHGKGRGPRPGKKKENYFDVKWRKKANPGISKSEGDGVAGHRREEKGRAPGSGNAQKEKKALCGVNRRGGEAQSLDDK